MIIAHDQQDIRTFLSSFRLPQILRHTNSPFPIGTTNASTLSSAKDRSIIGCKVFSVIDGIVSHQQAPTHHIRDNRLVTGAVYLFLCIQKTESDILPYPPDNQAHPRQSSSTVSLTSASLKVSSQPFAPFHPEFQRWLFCSLFLGRRARATGLSTRRWCQSQ